MGTRCANHVTPLYPQKLVLTLPTGGGRSVGMVRSRTKATELVLVVIFFGSLVVLTANGYFWIEPLLQPVSDIWSVPVWVTI